MKEIFEILTNKEVKALGFRVTGSAYEWKIEKDIKNVYYLNCGEKKYCFEDETTPDERLQHLTFATQKAGRKYFTENIAFITGREEFVVNLPTSSKENIDQTDSSFCGVDNAYWRHIKANGKNVPFVHNGVMYTRDAWPMKSNSGKTIVGWHVIYNGNDGTRLTNGNIALNRRHDPARNWGLGRD